MKWEDVRLGMRIETTDKLGSDEELYVYSFMKDHRQTNKPGIVKGACDRHGGRAWFVEHEGGREAAYWAEEFNPVDAPDTAPAE